MSSLRIFSLGCVFVIGVLLIVACGGDAEPTKTPPTAVPPTAVPVQPTAVPPTAAPAQPTQVPATAVPPTAAPAQPTQVPATAVPPTAAPVEPTTAPSASGAEPIPSFVPAAEWVDPDPDKFNRDDIDYIFPPGKGQDLTIFGCQGCHNWVPMVLAGYTRDAWLQNKINHKERASGMSDADYDYLYEYLIVTWPPDRPVPENIPQDLLDQWTSY